MSTQRDPNRHAVMCYTELDVLAKVRTVIKGKTVPTKQIGGRKVIKKRKPMGMSDFFIETVSRKVRNVKPDRESLEWADRTLEQNKRQRAKRDALVTSGVSKRRDAEYRRRSKAKKGK